MLENVSVTFSSLVDSGTRSLLISALNNALSRKGSFATVTTNTPDNNVTGPLFTVSYAASYSFASSDKSDNFSDTTTYVAVGDDLDRVAADFLDNRDFWLTKAYRNVVRGIGNVGAAIEAGTHPALPTGVSQAKYLSDLAYAACDAFPNSN